MKKICIYCQTWESGGIESFLHNVLQHMDLTGLKIDIVVDVLKKSVFTEGLKAQGVTFRELSGSSRALARNYRRFSKLLDEQRYDVVHLNVFHGVSLRYAHLAKGAGVPVRIVHSHCSALRKCATRPIKYILHYTARTLFTGSATDLWACSQPAAEFLFSERRLRERPYRFIANGIDVAKFRFCAAGRECIREELGLGNQLVVGTVGRLCSEKNQGFLLEVFAEIVRKRPDSRLLLVGRGEEEAALRQKAEALGITGQVIFYGVSDRVETLLWAMDVFAFPSLFEGLGIAGIEAQAAGLPVVCSDRIPTQARVLDRVRALPLGAGTKAWADAVLSLAGTPRTGGEAEQVRAAGFDIADVAPQIEAFYRGGADHGRA